MPAHQSDDDIPACQSCRRKKARCSREQPCSQCVRFNTDCIYDDRKLKPGLRAGAVDALSRRIETLENMFLGQGVLWREMWEGVYPGRMFPGVDKENGVNGGDSGNDNGEGIQRQKESIKRSLLQVAEHSGSGTGRMDEQGGTGDSARPTKRRMTSTELSSNDKEPPTPTEIIESELMTRLIEFYFDNIHHWIPILHIHRFRQQIRSREGRKRAVYVLYAIIAACTRFISHPILADEEKKSAVAEKCRREVVLHSMESFSVQNLQALVIIAFDTIARGRGPPSWSVVGSTTRTVEHLQLSVEEDNLQDRTQTQAGERLIRRITFINPSTCWQEAEERRRVFWTVFLMDRFCSVSTGWNVSLTSADVKRRLPCEGTLWQREEEVRAPYFGISDSALAGSNRPPASAILAGSPIGTGAGTDSAERSSIGGFAYCIEATESLALVSNFFVHQPLDVRNSDEAQLWLMRFKELDLRLVQWKLFLPTKWREASAVNADGIMDSNLTLAHITHNTAIILLHQAIAYPPGHWRTSPVKLPSSSSAESCLQAASEIASIGQQFLAFSSMLTNPQFSFCLFIAGRMLLTHSRFYGVAIPSELDTLIRSLSEISRRWAGPRDGNCDRVSERKKEESLASVFLKRLVQARDRKHPGCSLDIRQTVYSETAGDNADTSGATSQTVQASSHFNIPTTVPPEPFIGAGNPQTEQASFVDFQDQPLDPSLTFGFPPLPPSFQQVSSPFGLDVNAFDACLGSDGVGIGIGIGLPSASGWVSGWDSMAYLRTAGNHNNGSQASPGSAHASSGTV
ncbi:putative C6 transcription factor [Aspergillus stella-maris]|uniref:putative C6 transcription factor n=1 Tax=Aspergillus stella-maris TaxID=1810926 RepID=UPI003CCE1F89